MTKVGTFTATITLEHSTKQDATIRNCDFELTAKTVENLTFSKRSKAFATGGSFSVADILAGVQGNKTGFTIKSITDLSSNIVTISSSKTLDFKNVAGSFTATIILQHSTKADVTITNCEFEITKRNAENLTFTKRSKPFVSGGKFSVANILAGVSGTKDGYTVKNISNLSSNIVTVSSTKTLDFKNVAGAFTATIILQHSTKADVTIENCEFEISKNPAPTDFSFTKIIKQYDSGNRFTTNDILRAISGSKTNYTLKSITVSPLGIAGVSGTAPNLSLTMTKAGSFTATITLEHPTKRNVSIPSCEFEITKLTAPTLTWTKQEKAFASGGEITNADILAGLTGADADKQGYAIKTVTITNPDGTGATVDGAGTSAKITSYKKVGTLTLTLVFEHSTKKDVTLTNKEFQITKATAPTTLTWTKQNKVFASSGEITNADILAGLTSVNVADKQGYAIKSVEITDAAGTGATVDGAGTSAKIRSYTKAGTLTLTLVFEHITKADVSIPNCAFEITKATAPTLTWTKQTKVFARGGEITNADILAGLTGSDADKQGYTIKTVTITDKAGTGARMDGSGTSAKITSYTKAGTLTLTLVFEHSTKADVSIPSCQFEIRNLPPTDITLSANTIDENKPIGTEIATLTTTDPNVGDSFTYTLVAGDGADNNADFTIDGNKLKSNKIFDYETKKSYKIRIKTTDNFAGGFEKKFTIAINDLPSYTVTFNVEGNTATTPSIQVEGGKKATKPNNPTKVGYQFVNWYKENSFQNVFNFATEIITGNITLYAKFNRPPTLKQGAEWEIIRISFLRTNPPTDVSHNNLTLYFSDPDGDALSYEIVSVFKDGGNSDKKNSFSIDRNNHIQTTLNGNVAADRGYYRMKITVTDTWGGEFEYNINAIVYDTLKDFYIDLSLFNKPTTLVAVNIINPNYIRTGAGNDFLNLFLNKGGIIDAGTGNNQYRINKSSKNFYLHNFNNGDKIYLAREYDSNKDGRKKTISKILFLPPMPTAIVLLPMPAIKTESFSFKPRESFTETKAAMLFSKPAIAQWI